MLTPNEKNIINSLKETNPEAYNIICREEKLHRELLKIGCHDVMNSISYISSSYQLLKMKNPELDQIPKFYRIGDGIEELLRSMKMISKFRYADVISMSQTSVTEIISRIHSYIYQKYPDNTNLFTFQRECEDFEILCDIEKIVEALSYLIDNAVEEIISANTDETWDSINVSFKHKINIVLKRESLLEKNVAVVQISNPLLSQNSLYETNPEIFAEPFWKGKQHHAGLGSSIAAKILNAHLGNITYNRSGDILTALVIIPEN